MKTAEEWWREAGVGEKTCKAIQLDAERSGYERGVRESAAIALEHHEKRGVGFSISVAICTLLNKKEDKE